MAITAAAVKAYVEKLPPLPVTTNKIIRLTQDANSTPQEIANTIAMDPTLAAKILKLVNSAYFSLPQEVTQVSKAIILLGMSTVRNVAISGSTMGYLKKQQTDGGIDLDAFWHHSVACGVAAKAIAQKCGVDRKELEDYFVAGLMHDIGVVAMNMLDPRALKVAHDKAMEDGHNTLQYELKFTGTTHAHVGLQMAQFWKLPNKILVAIAYHHDVRPPEKEYSQFINIIHLANVYCWWKGYGVKRATTPDKLTPLFEAVGMKFEDILEMEQSIFDGIEKAKVFIQS